jgi:hypothetical protein
MSVIALAMMLASQDLIITERPVPAWVSQKVEGQCGLIVARLEHKTTHNAKKPDVLKGSVAYGSQKHSLEKQLDAISGRVTGVRDISIACESLEKLSISISTNTDNGEKVFVLYVNTLLEVLMVEP